MPTKTFTSYEFKEFVESNEVHHILLAYHPAYNRLAERAIQTVKYAFLQQMLHDAKYYQSHSLQRRKDSLLFVYCNTPHTITGLLTSEEIKKFKLCTHFSLLKPHLADHLFTEENLELSL